MTAFKKGIALVVAGGLLAALFEAPAISQGAVTLVQLVLGGTAVSTSNPLPVTGSFSTTAFTPNGVFATLTATGSSASVALPTGTTIAFQNSGTTTVSCTLGIGSATATANEIQVASGSTVFVTPGSNTYGACIDQTGSASNLVVLAGGVGLGAGFGGGGSGGSVTQGTTPWVDNITQWNGAALAAATAWGVAPSGNVPGVNANILNSSIQVGGYNAGVAFTPTVQNAAYSSGNAMGGLQTVSFFRSTTQPSGIFDNFSIASKGGATVAMTIYIFDTNPTASTCTDKSAFALNSADASKLAMTPFVLTPAVIGAGTTETFAQLTQSVSVKNQDGTATANLYVCIVAGGSVTPATTSDLVAKISGALD